MQGSLANGSSNANYQKGVVGDLTKGVRSTHTWRNDYNQQDNTLGPFELRFEKPISLLSLTCKLTFNCDATSDLLQ
jgi:hypothetical protein